MKIAEYIQDVIKQRVKNKKCLIIYDPVQRYKNIVLSLKNKQNSVIDGSNSIITSRENALSEWISLNTKLKKNLFIYLPYKKPVNDTERRMNPFEIFAIGGAVFPDGDGDAYKSLCLQAFPDNAEQIEELFRSNIPTFEAIDSLKGDIRWPLLKTTLNAESSKEIILAIMCPNEKELEFFQKDNSWISEYKNLCIESLGFSPASASDFSALQKELWRYVLMSEFAFDLPEKLPDSLKEINRALIEYENKIYQICDTLRQNDNYKETYVEKSRIIEDEYSLNDKTKHLKDLGKRDTFLFENIRPRKILSDLVKKNEIEELKKLLAKKQTSLWAIQDADAHQLWEMVSVVIKLLISIENNVELLIKNNSTLEKIINYYSLYAYQIDTLFIEFEYILQEIMDLDRLHDFINIIRHKYYQFINKQQGVFISLVKREGWYPDGVQRNLDFFSKYVEKNIDIKKTAIFMVDALRYELAYKIEERFSGKYRVTIESALSTLPSITSPGMAALLPNADEKYEIKVEDNKLIPYIKNTRVYTPDDRIKYLNKIYGDRCKLIDITEINSSINLKIAEKVDLLVVKTTDIDTTGEKLPFSASSIIPNIIRNLIKGVEKTIRMGFEQILIATDHGFMLFPFSESGTSIDKPQGDWHVIGKRYLVGRGQIGNNLINLSKEKIGINISADDIIFPANFATFVKGVIYLHGGISLQECVIPIITIEVEKRKHKKKEQIDIELTYKGKDFGRITTRRPMITIAIHEEQDENDLFKDILEKQDVELLIQAYKGKKIIGKPAPNKYIDSASGLIRIQKGSVVKIPLMMEEDFKGEFEIKVFNPVTNERYASIKLETNYLE